MHKFISKIINLYFIFAKRNEKVYIIILFLILLKNIYINLFQDDIIRIVEEVK